MSNERAVKLFDDLVDVVKDFVRRHDVTHDEYRAAVMFLHEVGTSGEMPLLLDVFVESTVNDANFAGKPGTPACIEGPYYIPGAPQLTPPYELPHRDNEPGEPLVMSGTVTSSGGSPLAGAVIDVWQSDSEGHYSNVDPAVPEWNLRGALRTGDDGTYEFKTYAPSCYEIPKAGPTGKLLEILGRHAFRPAHLHFKVSAPGHETLTTQLFFEGDEWLGSDVAGADNHAELVLKAESNGDGLVAHYDFVLAGNER